MTHFRLRTEHVAWTDVDGEIVALDEQSAVYLAANESGGVLWRSLVDGASHEQLVQTLAQAYGLDIERAAHDTDAFLAALREQGMLETP